MPGLLLLVAAASVMCLSAQPVRGDGDELVIGLLPEMNVFKQRKRFQPLVEHLSRETGVKVRLTLLSRYGNIVQRLSEEKVDAAFLGSFTGALAISQLKVEPLARPVNMDGTSTYHGYIFVRADSGITNAATMKGKTLALVERATTAGYVFPLAWLKHNGVADVEAHFAEHFFTGSHDAAVEAVLDGKADVGAAKNTIYEHVFRDHPDTTNALRIVASSPRVPSNGLCVSPGFPEKLKRDIRKALLGLHLTDEGRSVLSVLKAKRFVPTSRDDYAPVVEMAKEAGIDLSAYRYYNP